MEVFDLYRWSGAIGIIAGILNVMVEFLPERLGQPLDLLVNTLGLWVLAALYFRQREASGVFGLIAYGIQSFGMALVIGFLFTQAFVLSELDVAQRAAILAGPSGVATVIALAIVTLGAVLFGIVTFRAGVFPKWAALLLMIGFIMTPIGAFAPHLIKSTGEVILSAGLIGLSYALVSGAADTKPTRLISN
jgi:hypothetical protein